MIIKQLEARVDMCFAALLIVLQGIAVYVGGKPVSITIPIAILWAVYKLLSRGYLRRSVIFSFIVFGSAASAATLASRWSGGDPNVLSWAYLMALYFTVALVRGVTISSQAASSILDGFCCIMAALGVTALLQQFVQALHGSYIDYTMLPDFLVLDNYNARVPVSSESAFFKSNGVFLLEPSFLSKLSALAVVVEAYRRKRIWILCMLSVGILTSFSGSGLVLLLVAAPFLIKRFSSNRLALVVLLALALLYVISGFADVFIGRVAEFSITTSSAYIRFVAPYVAIFNGWEDLNLLWGSGVSTLEQSVIGGFSFEKMSSDVTALAYDVTLVKVLVELGILGLAGYAFFYTRLFATRKLEAGFIVSLVSIVWVTSGALFSAPIMLLLALLSSAMEGGRSEKSVDIRNV